MSPRITFQSWGISSSLKRRSQRPTGVIRASPLAVSWLPSGVSPQATFIVRSLSRVKGRPFRPTRCCRKRTGLGEVAATRRRMGEATASPRQARVASTARGKPRPASTSPPAAFTNPLDDSDNMLVLRIRHRGEERKGDDALPDRRGSRKILRPPAERLGIVGMEVQRPPVNRAAYARFLQFRDETVPINR